MYQKQNLMMLMAMAMMASQKKGQEFEPDDQARENRVVRPKGHKAFWVNGVEVWALNRKNAEKKYHRENAPFK